MPSPPPERGIVMIVDDVPENLAFLSDALDQDGYMVIVATDGDAALERVRHIRPDVILLDAIMPRMDGFETCRRLKADARTRDIPVVFMTGLTDTMHVVQGFAAGGTDYVTKPIQPAEVLARIAAHIRNARLANQAFGAVNALGFGMIVLDAGGDPLWISPTAQTWLAESAAPAPDTLRTWARAQIAARAAGNGTPATTFAGAGGRRLNAHFLGSARGDEFVVLLHEQDGGDMAHTLQTSYQLTTREVEVLLWVAKGKTNKDIGEILGTSPRTVNKHLERIYVKLGVETRAAATALAMATHAKPRTHRA